MPGAKPKKLCFVIGPIGKPDSDVRVHADWLLEGIIQPVMNDFPEFAVKRADQDPRPGLIDAQMINDLLNADLVIADLSLRNPNAFYEIGIRHMAQKPIIHVQLANEDTPFDVSLYRAVKFSLARIADVNAAKTALKEVVQAVLAPGYQVENPVTNARGRLALNEHATPAQRVLIDQVQAVQERLSQMESMMAAIFDRTMRSNQLIPGFPQTNNTLTLEQAARNAYLMAEALRRSATVIQGEPISSIAPSASNKLPE